MKTKMKWTLIIFLLIIINGTLIVLVNAEDYPTIKPWVNDFAGLMTPDQVAALDYRCEQIKQNTSYEIAIVTLKDTKGQDRLEYANRIGEQAGVGNQQKDNGVVVLWSMDNEKGGAIAVGRGAESFLNDAKVGEIGRASRPLFDKGQYYEGFTEILNNIEKTIKERDVTAGTTPTNNNPLGNNTWIIITILVILLIFIILKVADINPRIRTGGIFTGSSNSSGGGSFGGGSFGGGGSKF